MLWLRSLCCGQPLKKRDGEADHQSLPQVEAVRAVRDRIRLAASCTSWHTVASTTVEVLRAAMGPQSHVSIFGASPCGDSLVLLGSGGPGAAAVLLPVGHVLPSPWSCDAEKDDDEAAAVASRVRRRRTLRRTISWTAGSRGAAATAEELMRPRGAGGPREAAWAGLRSRLLAALAAVAARPPAPSALPHPTSPPQRPKAPKQQQPELRLLLIPLELGSQLVGALLCGQNAAEPAIAAAPAAPAPVSSSSSAAASDEAAHVHAHVYADISSSSSGGACNGNGGGGRPSALRLCSSSTTATERAVAGVLVDCLFAPHLRALQQVCGAAHQLSHTADICNIASVLSYIILDAIRTELHLDVQVRLAVAAAAAATGGGGAAGAQYGFMMQLRPPSALASHAAISQMEAAATAAGTAPLWQIQTADLQPTPATSGPAAAALSAPRIMAAVAASDGRGSGGSRGSQMARQARLQQTNDGRGGGSGFDVPSRTGSFLLVTTAETTRMDTGLGAGADDLQQPLASKNGAAAVVAACRLLSDTAQRERRPWKAIPFAFATSLFRDLLREERPLQSTPSTNLPTSTLYGATYFSSHGYGKGATATTTFGRLGGPASSVSPAVAAGGNAADGPVSAAEPVAADGRIRVTTTVLNDLHIYIQEVDQPGSDVLMLLGQNRRGNTTAVSGAGTSGAAAISPACLVLLGSDGGGGAAVSNGAMPRRGMSGDLGPLSPTPEDVYGGDIDEYGSGGGATDMVSSGSSGRPSLAVFITSSDRLPPALLRAVRDVGQRLLEVLLPAALGSLTWGLASSELAGMNQLIGSHVLPGSGTGMAAVPGRRDSGACCTACLPASVIGGGVAAPQPMLPHQCSGNTNCASCMAAASPATGMAAAVAAGPFDPAAAAAAAAAVSGTAPVAAYDASVRLSPALPRGTSSVAAAVPPSTVAALVVPPPRPPLRKFSSRSSILSRAQVRTPASTGDGRDGLMPDSPASSWGGGGGGRTLGGGGRRLPAEFVASMLSPFSTSSATPPVVPGNRLVNHHSHQSTTVNGAIDVSIASGGGGGCSCSGGGGSAVSSPSLVPHLLRARLAGTASVGSVLPHPHAARQVASELLDLDGLKRGSGLVYARVPELPPMDVLLASCYSTLNDTETDLSPYASEDLRFLRLTQVLGDGGCSVVYAGRLLGLEVAVKLLEPLPDPPELPCSGQQELAAVQDAVQSVPQPQGPDRDAGGGAATQQQPLSPPKHHQALLAAARQARLKDLMRGARELAVLTSLSHPNIVQVYSYHTNVTVIPGPGPNDLPKLLPATHKQQQKLQPQQQPQQPGGCGPLRVAIVMECCDMGCLADALDSGRFKEAIIRAATAAQSGASEVRRASSNVDHKRTFPAATAAATAVSPSPSTAALTVERTGSSMTAQIGGGVAMRAIYLTLLEVALALRHLHARSLAHCDVKAANVLLKSSKSDPRGFTCKLGDFGLVSIVRKEAAGAGESATASQSQSQLQVQPAQKQQQDGAVGTITHLAPEYFSPGTRLDFSVDMYAFGIVMWEVFTSKPPYMEHAARGFKDLPQQVVYDNLRPRWPAHVPPAYRALAVACWAADPSERPTAAAVVSALQHLMES